MKTGSGIYLAKQLSEAPTLIFTREHVVRGSTSYFVVVVIVVVVVVVVVGDP